MGVCGIYTGKRGERLGPGSGQWAWREKDGVEKHPADKTAGAGNGLICGVATEREASRFPAY